MLKREAKGKYGDLFEKKVIEKFNLINEKGHTHKWDAYTKTGIPVSIKLANINNEIVMSDIFTQATNNEDFFMVLGVWKNDKRVVDNVVIIRVFKDEWRKMFYSHDALVLFSVMIDRFKGKVDDDSRYKWADMRRVAYEFFMNDTNGIVKPRARFVTPNKAERARIEANLGYRESINDVVDRSKYGNHRVQCAVKTRDFTKLITNEWRKNVTAHYKNFIIEESY